MFILHFPEWPFLGLFGEAGSLPITFTPAFSRSYNLPFGLFCFTRCVVQHPGYLFFWLNSLAWSSKSLKGSAPFLRVLLTVFFRCFHRRLQCCWRCWLRFPRALSVRLCHYPITIIISCCRVFQILQLRCPEAVLSLFPCAKGLQSSQGGYFAIAKRCPGEYSPYFLLSL